MKRIKRFNPRDLGLLLVGTLLGVLLGASSLISGEAISGLLGVLIGALIPSIFQNWASTLDRKNQLRLAAIDRRLEVHQEAYTLWVELIPKVHKSDEIGSFVIQCQKWWNENCLFLTPNARKAFREAYTSAFNHSDLINARKDISRNSPDGEYLVELDKNIDESWDNICAAGEAIVKGVALPTIGDEVSRNISPLNNN